MHMRKYATAIGRALALGALAGLDVVLAALATVAVALSFGLGMIFLIPPTTTLVRHRTRLGRRLNGAWLGAGTPAPYLPPPLPTRPQPDGWYRHDRRLYKTPRWPDWNKRWLW